MVTVIDSGIANIGSVVAAFRRIGAEVEVAKTPAAVARARSLVLPGVGAFGDGMASLRQHELVEPLRAAVHRSVPLLGICLGMQLLADTSEEFGANNGLGLIPGRVVRLEPGPASARVPNIGWCDVFPRMDSPLFRQTVPGTACYFVHSYHLVCADPADEAAKIHFGGTKITVAVQQGSIFGVQFHPEKSQDAGLRILAHFVNHLDASSPNAF